ncbi:TPA: hypothetical protein H1016_00470 [archaeon]|uniref:C2H2-type domain-containing protein n=1 Tax=Candidatus Naiadarchaeum limnaeum TaxID=2756139 RepID=A0A832V2V6_9ARCH|nr:hypothetical protein [Candidatus Naiadarchaeum limnaeum]
MAFKCEKCGHEFNSHDALAQHLDTKHGRKKTYTYALLAVVVLLIIAIGYFVINAPKSPQTPIGNVDDRFVLETNIAHTGLAMHIHPELDITINEQPFIFPEGIGTTSTTMNIIHTHDQTGKLHVESPVVKEFKLRHFFLTWSKWSGKEKVFNSTCILDYCNTDAKKVKMTVNGGENFEYENLILMDLERIEIKYS